jgi:hypothetical protein
MVFGILMLFTSAVLSNPFGYVTTATAARSIDTQQAPYVTLPRSVEPSRSELVSQGLCRTFIGEYPSHDHAIRVQNSIRRKGFQAWIEARGCITCTVNTRTYAVFANLPCR